MEMLRRWAARRAAASEDQFWAEGLREMRPSEQRVNYAHVFRAGEDRLAPVTVFLTTARVVIREFGPGGSYLPTGWFYELRDIKKVIRQQRAYLFDPGWDRSRFYLWFFDDTGLAPEMFGGRAGGRSTRLAARLADDIEARLVPGQSRFYPNGELET